MCVTVFWVTALSLAVLHSSHFIFSILLHLLSKSPFPPHPLLLILCLLITASFPPSCHPHPRFYSLSLCLRYNTSTTKISCCQAVERYLPKFHNFYFLTHCQKLALQQNKAVFNNLPVLRLYQWFQSFYV